MRFDGGKVALSGGRAFLMVAALLLAASVYHGEGSEPSPKAVEKAPEMLRLLSVMSMRLANEQNEATQWLTNSTKRCNETLVYSEQSLSAAKHRLSDLIDYGKSTKERVNKLTEEIENQVAALVANQKLIVEAARKLKEGDEFRKVQKEEFEEQERQTSTLLKALDEMRLIIASSYNNSIVEIHPEDFQNASSVKQFPSGDIDNQTVVRNHQCTGSEAEKDRSCMPYHRKETDMSVLDPEKLRRLLDDFSRLEFPKDEPRNPLQVGGTSRALNTQLPRGEVFTHPNGSTLPSRELNETGGPSIVWSSEKSPSFLEVVTSYPPGEEATQNSASVSDDHLSKIINGTLLNETSGDMSPDKDFRYVKTLFGVLKQQVVDYGEQIKLQDQQREQKWKELKGALEGELENLKQAQTRLTRTKHDKEAERVFVKSTSEKGTKGIVELQRQVSMFESMVTFSQKECKQKEDIHRRESKTRTQQMLLIGKAQVLLQNLFETL